MVSLSSRLLFCPDEEISWIQAKARLEGQWPPVDRQSNQFSVCADEVISLTEEDGGSGEGFLNALAFVPSGGPSSSPAT